MFYICYWNRPGPWSVTLSTGNLYCRLSPIENLEYRNKKSYKFHKVPNSKIDHKFKPGFYEQSKELLKAAKGKKSKIVTLKDFIITMDITKKIYK